MSGLKSILLLVNIVYLVLLIFRENLFVQNHSAKNSTSVLV